MLWRFIAKVDIHISRRDRWKSIIATLISFNWYVLEAFFGCDSAAAPDNVASEIQHQYLDNAVQGIKS